MYLDAKCTCERNSVRWNLQVRPRRRHRRDVQGSTLHEVLEVHSMFLVRMLRRTLNKAHGRKTRQTSGLQNHPITAASPPAGNTTLWEMVCSGDGTTSATDGLDGLVNHEHP